MSSELERLIGHAVLDPEFREQVLNDPERAANAGGFNLEDTELERLKSLVEDYQKTGWTDSIKDIRAIW